MNIALTQAIIDLYNIARLVENETAAIVLANQIKNCADQLARIAKAE